MASRVRIAFMQLLILAACIRGGGGSEIELPDLAAARHAGGVGQLTWPLRVVLWGLLEVAIQRQLELDDLRIHVELQGQPMPLIFPIHEAAEEGVAQTLHLGAELTAGGGIGAELRGRAHACRLRVYIRPGAIVDSEIIQGQPN